ncbi:MAG: ABC transporter permease [Proteobacteria bacterium]|nr:ABC transporter permease [Pseudomonadota bacterium]
MKNLILRHLNLIDYAIWNLKRNKLKNSLIFFIYTFCIFLVSSVLMFTSSLNREAKEILAHAPDMIVQKVVAGRHDLIEISYLDTLKGIRGISEIKPRLWGYYFEPNLRVNFSLVVPLNEQPEKGSIYIGSGVAKILKKTENDFLPFVKTSKESLLLEIEKVIEFETSLMTNDLIIMNEEDFRNITGMGENKFTDIALFINNKNEIDKIAEKILNSMPNVRVVTKSSILKTYDSLFNWRSSLVFFLISMVLVAFLIVAVDRFISINVDDRNEIGLLKALGWDTSDTIILKSWESVVISSLSFLIGINSAYIHIFLFDARIFKPIIMGWSVLYPHFNLVPNINMWTLITIFAITVLPFILFSIVSVWRLSITEPDVAMR